MLLEVLIVLYSTIQFIEMKTADFVVLRITLEHYSDLETTVGESDMKTNIEH